MRKFIHNHFGWSIGTVNVLIVISAIAIVYFTAKAVMAYPN
jgi:hypothetical protein